MGSESFSLGYGTSATLASDATNLAQTGSGSGSADSAYSYSYSGGGSGSTPQSESGTYFPNTAWSLNEHGSGSGTSSYSDPWTLGSGGWTDNASISASTRDESVYAYNTSGSYGDTNNGKTWTANANDNEITTTTSNPDYTLFWWDSTPSYGGSGSASGSATTYSGGGRLDGGLERFVGSHVRWQRHFHDGVRVYFRILDHPALLLFVVWLRAGSRAGAGKGRWCGQFRCCDYGRDCFALERGRRVQCV